MKLETPAAQTQAPLPILAGGVAAVLVLLLHFQIGNISGFPLTIALPAISIIVLRQRGAPEVRFVFMILLALVLPLAVAAVSDIDFAHFCRTYLLLTLAVGTSWSILSFAASAGRGADWLSASRRRSVYVGLTSSLGVVAVLSVVQFVSGSSGSQAWFNLLGNYQYLYQYQPNLQFGVVRAQGLYLEPSFNALVICCLMTVLLSGNYKPRLVLTLSIMGILSTRSLSGLLVLIIVIALVGFFPVGGRVVSGTWLLAGLLSLVSFSYISSRVATTTVRGSSVNFRVVAPLQILQNSLSQYPFGAPLGSTSTAVGAASIYNGSRLGTSLDNGYYLIIFYFGFLGIAAVITYIAVWIRTAWTLRAKMHRWWSITLVPIAMPLFTGGVLLPEYLLLFYGVSICIIRSANGRS